MLNLTSTQCMYTVERDGWELCNYFLIRAVPILRSYPPWLTANFTNHCNKLYFLWLMTYTRIQIDVSREINWVKRAVKSHGHMSTISSPCNLQSAISSSTSSSPSPEPSCFTLFATQKLTYKFTQASKRSPSFKKRESFCCCIFCIFFRLVLHFLVSIVEHLLASLSSSCQHPPHLSRWPLEG